MTEVKLTRLTKAAENCSSRKVVKVEANLEVSDEEWYLKQREDREDKMVMAARK